MEIYAHTDADKGREMNLGIDLVAPMNKKVTEVVTPWKKAKGKKQGEKKGNSLGDNGGGSGARTPMGD